MLVDERAAPDARTREEALTELAWRYFVSRGPATVRDFAGWASLTLKEAEQAGQAVADGLSRLDVGARTYWVPAGTEPPETAGGLHFIQGLDKVVLSYSESRDVLAEPEARRARSSRSSILHIGRLTSFWRYERRGRAFVVQTRFFAEPTDEDRADVDSFTGAFGSFVGAEVTWED